MSAGSRGCAEGPAGPGVPTAGAEAWSRQWLGPGNTNVAQLGSGWGSTGIPPSQHPPRPHPPRVVPSHQTTRTAVRTRRNSCFEVDQGDPRGIERTWILGCSAGGLTHGAAVSSGACLTHRAAATASVLRLQVLRLQVLRLQVLKSQVLKSQVLKSQVSGSQVSGSQVSGSQASGSQASGSQALL